MRFAIHILGAVELTDDGEPVTVTRPQSRQILGLLAAAEGAWVPASVIEDDLWPDEDHAPQSPTTALRTVISRTREKFDTDGAAIIESRGDAYRVALDTCDVDLARWSELTAAGRRDLAAGRGPRAVEQFAAARRLWRGEPFDGITSSNALDRIRDRLIQARIAADLDEAAALHMADRPGDGADLLLTTRTREVLREDIVVAIMELLSACGRVAEGLRLANDFADLLREQIGAAPSARFERAHHDLLRGGAGVAPKTAPRREWRTPFLDDVAATAIDCLVDPNPAALALVAPTGFGVSSALQRIAARIRQQRPLAAVHLVHARPGHPHSIRGVVGTIADENATDTGRQQGLLLDRMATIAHEQGLALIIDDTEDLDDWSSTVVDNLRDGLPHGMALITGGHAAVRGPEHDLTLDPIGARDVSALLAEAAPELSTADRHRATDRIVDWCGGNPGWAIAAVEAVAADGVDASLPVVPAVGAQIEKSLDGLDPETRLLLRRAAVLGDTVDPVLIAAVAEEQPRDVADVVARLGLAVAREILAPTDTPGIWAFGDAPTRAHLTTGASIDETTQLHARAAEWIRANHGSAAAVARHLVAALPLGDRADAERTAIAGGRELLAEGRYRDAATLFGDAVELSATTEAADAARVLHADALERAGDHPRANDLYNTVVDRIGALSGERASDLLAEVALGGAGRSSRIGGQEGRRRRLGIAYRQLDPAHPRADEVAAEYALELLISGFEIDDALWLRLVESAKGDDTAGQLLARRLMVIVTQLDTGASIADGRNLATMAMRPELRRRALHCGAALTVAIQVALVTGEWKIASEWIKELEQVGRSTGEPRSRWQSAAFRAALAEARGETAEADTLASEALRIGRRLDTADASNTFATHYLGRGFRSGSIAFAADDLAEIADRYRFPVWYALRGLAELDRGDEATARHLLDEALTRLRTSQDTFRPPALALVVALAARLEQSERTAALANDLQGRSGGMVFLGYGGPFLGPVDWFLSIRDASLGDSESAAARHADAVAAAKRAGADGWVRDHES